MDDIIMDLGRIRWGGIEWIGLGSIECWEVLE
jgi:hypothetical protein